jgi:hypothetical protein
MRNKLGIEDVSKLIFMTENDYLLHLGENYEKTILSAKKEMEPVVRLLNINGTYSSIPLERSLQMLEKYYKLVQKKCEKPDNVISMQTTVEQSDSTQENVMLEEQKKMA